jgi:flagellar hook-associated protein 1 FlgK
VSDIFNTAFQGLTAYRKALSVTGENIANVDSEGYHRRDVLLDPAGGARGSVLSEGRSDSGLRGTDVRRALDWLAAARSRTAASDKAAADVLAPTLETLEGRLTEGGPREALSGMMRALAQAAAAPQNDGVRATVLAAGETLAASVADLGRDIDRMARGLSDRAAQTVTGANTTLEALARVQREIAGAGDGDSLAPLLDRRDRLVTDLAETVGVTVEPDARDPDLVRITLGDKPGRPALLDRGSAAHLDVDAQGTLTVRPPAVGAPAQTHVPETGRLGGLSQTLGALRATAGTLDGWAQKIADDMAAVHADGRTRAGDPGGALFSLDGWTVRPALANTGVWRGYDASGTEFATGADRIDVPGLSVTFPGEAAEGDRFTLAPNHGAAENMRFLPTDPGQLAAGGAITVSPDSANTGGATLAVARTGPHTDAIDVRIRDAATGEVAIHDAASGAEIATGTLDADGRVSAGALTLTLTGAGATGDSYRVVFDSPGAADNRTFAALADLATEDPSSGLGGFGARYDDILADFGAQVSAARTRQEGTAAVKDRADRAMAEVSGVDLDTEAARLSSYQQAYEANARALNVAREIFETLLNSM